MAQETFQDRLKWLLHKLWLFILLLKACACESVRLGFRSFVSFLSWSASFLRESASRFAGFVCDLWGSVKRFSASAFSAFLGCLCGLCSALWFRLRTGFTRVHALIILIVLFIAIVCLIIHKGVSKTSEGWHFRNPNTLIVATDYNTLDYCVVDGRQQGFQYELVKAFAESQGMDVEWRLENDLSKSISMLDNGDVDLIARPIPVTTEMREQVLFSHPVLQTRKVLVQRKAEFNDSIEPIRDQLELAGKTIYVPRNSPDILRLRNLSDEIADTIIIKEVADYQESQLVMMVAHGDIDFTVCGEKEALEASSKMPQIDCQTAVGFQQLHAWAVQVSNEDLCARVDSFLTHFERTSKFRKLYLKYYSGK